MRRLTILLPLALLALALVPAASQAAVCADYPNQAAAQRAADTRDADGDGIYCESLPCPCATGNSTPSTPVPTSAPAAKTSCTRPRTVVVLTFSASKYPRIKKHTLAAIRKGWPRILVLDRPGASARRDRLLEDIPTRSGYDRDEYPPAVGRGKPNGTARGLVRGINPVGWMADVAYVPSAENRSHGSSLGAKLKHYCNGTRFRYAFG